MKKQFCYTLFLLVIFPITALAHPGRTDGSGCHTCRTNCSNWGLSKGEYHCHQSKGVPQPIAPIHSVRNTEGVGYTVPAPEYVAPKAKPVIAEVKKEVLPKNIKPAAKDVRGDVKVNSPIIKKEIKKPILDSKPVLSPLQVENNLTASSSAEPVKSPIVIEKKAWYKKAFSFMFN